MPIHTCFHVPERRQDADHTCFYVSARPKESPGGRPIRVFLRVFLESGSGPRMAQETDSYVFYHAFLACGPHHTCFYVSAVVGRRVGVVWRDLADLSFLAFW